MIIYTDLNFTLNLKELRNFTVKQVTNDCVTYNIVNGKGLVYDLKSEINVSQRLLWLKKEMIKDDQDKILLVLFGWLIDNLEINK